MLENLTENCMACMVEKIVQNFSNAGLIEESEMEVFTASLSDSFIAICFDCREHSIEEWGNGALAEVDDDGDEDSDDDESLVIEEVPIITSN